MWHGHGWADAEGLAFERHTEIVRVGDGKLLAKARTRVVSGGCEDPAADGAGSRGSGAIFGFGTEGRWRRMYSERL